MSTLTDEEYIRTLYRLLLQRAPDKEGMRNWLETISTSGDKTTVLAGILGSHEYQMRIMSPETPSLKALLLGLVRQPFRIIDVGAQILETEDHIYQPIVDAGLACHVIGFEPLQHRVEERKNLEGRPSVTLLPYAIGDGGRHVLHVNNEDATSSLYPLNSQFCADFEHLHTLNTVETIEVETHKLDDVIDVGRADFLKIDVQGAELMVLDGAKNLLQQTAAIHCEVEFAPIYLGQPLYPEIDRFLTGQGFYLADILIRHRYSYRHSNTATPDRLLWADAIFFKASDDRDVLVSQAQTAYFIYKKFSLAQHLIKAAGI